MSFEKIIRYADYDIYFDFVYNKRDRSLSLDGPWRAYRGDSIQEEMITDIELVEEIDEEVAMHLTWLNEDAGIDWRVS